MQADQVTIDGEDFVGLIGMATDRYAIVSRLYPAERILDVPTLKTKAYGTNLVGMFCAGNSNGLILPYFIPDHELADIRSFLKGAGARILKLTDRHTAIGNMIAANDRKAFVSSSLTQDYREIEDILGVEVVTGDVAGHPEVGAYVAATNRGFLAHPSAEADIERISGMLGVKGMVGTVNCGVPYVKAGLIANSNGYVTGSKTTPIEMQRIEDALGFV